MNLSFKPNEIKQEVKETKLSRHIEAINQTKTASFFRIRLTHIETNISVDATGYNKIDVMSKCLNNLNKYVIAKKFEDEIPKENIFYEIEEISNVVK